MEFIRLSQLVLRAFYNSYCCIGMLISNINASVLTQYTVFYDNR
ncbi:hypothetical protein PRUB_b0714 [Pseudoalteromonas rubra]|uniref:Uncharacterized protein n=1 Tax=Pseudoalteromonas rubra TaxID=43658 RepID=A0A8T0C2L9_9GAMM|nr:hypothetical protein PRUB_b0714 [Pseudoalteromonas rubra]